MCGIAGQLLFDRSASADAGLLSRMAQAIAHRGPDDQGVWVDGPVGLVSRRLAVIDLSPRGHQPMASADGSVHIAFNGEIYNFRELRAALESKGHQFRSDSDTEVILHLYETQGTDLVRHLSGMFAFAIWDARRRRMLLARDRLGKKPLFYFVDDRGIWFGSEPKAFFEDPAVPAEVHVEAVARYLTLGYVPAEESAFKGVRRLPPAHIAVIEDGRVQVARYWQLRYEPKRTESEASLVEETRERLRSAVRKRLVSDVPVGALLSGGLDSSGVVALMCQEHPGPVRTFSIGFEEAAYDERVHAERVARHLGTEHTTFVVRPDATAMLQRLVWHYNDPFADSSALPSFALSELARRHVTVALSGDGGDEAFIGYDRYRAVHAASRLERLPLPFRRLAAAVARSIPAPNPRSSFGRLARFGRAADEPALEQYIRWLTIFDAEARADLMTPEFAQRLKGPDGESVLRAAALASPARSPVEQAVCTDINSYLPDDLLVKMDIASMAHSLEVRSPLLDHELVEFAASLPLDLKVREGGKYALRRAVGHLLPAETLARAKQGFGVPLDHWFRHDLRDMTRDLLLDATARGRGYFRPGAVRRLIDEHASGRAFHHQRLWALLMLELWHRMFIDRRGTAASQRPPEIRLESGSVVAARR